MNLREDRWVICIAALLACQPNATPVRHDGAEQTNVRNLTYKRDATNIDYNPLKGLVPRTDLRSGNNPYYSMERFYVGLSEVMTGDNAFNWAALETKLNDIASRGNQAIFRVYIDYPSRPSALPTYLTQGTNAVALRDYTANDNANNVSKCPDWNNSRLVTACAQFITALGRQYDGDPRIAYFTAGIYGFWGEWHTFPYHGINSNPDWRMTPTNKQQLLSAYIANFTKTQVLLRYPEEGVSDWATLKTKFGYHDDSFAFETLTDTWHFWPRVRAEVSPDIWKTKSIGGEVRPEVENDNGFLFDNYPNTSSPAGNNFDECVSTTHASWQWCYSPFNRTLTPSQLANTLKAHRRLGYEFYVSTIDMPALVGTSDPLNIRVRITNGGVAPFPYNWRIDLIAIKASDSSYVKTLANPDWNLPSLLPATEPNADDPERTALNITHGLPRGVYKILLRFANPVEYK